MHTAILGLLNLAQRAMVVRARVVREEGGEQICGRWVSTKPAHSSTPDFEWNDHVQFKLASQDCVVEVALWVMKGNKEVWQH